MEYYISLRKQYLSTPEIKAIMDANGNTISEKGIYNILNKEGFSRLPRRNKSIQSNPSLDEILVAPKSKLLAMEDEEFSTQHAGLFCLIPYIKAYGIDVLIQNSGFPETKMLPVLNSILSFVALKVSSIRRYTVDDLWCMDRGLGAFSGLNVLPKSGWFTSYSHRVTSEMNLSFT